MPSVFDPSRGGPSQIDWDDDDWATDIEGVDRRHRDGEEDDDDDRDHDDKGTVGTHIPAHLELRELESNDDGWAEGIDDPAAAEEEEKDGKRRAEVRKPDAGDDGGRWAARTDPLSVAAGASPSLRGAAAAEYGAASFRVAVAAAAATAAPLSVEEEDSGRRGQPAWRFPDGGGDENCRREMVEIITTLLTSRKKSGPPPSQKWIAELPHKVRRLEEALYLRAPSLEAYLDRKSLKARLESVSTDIAARFRKRKRRSSPTEGAAAGVGADAGTLSAAQPPPAKMGKWCGGMADGGTRPSTSGIGAVASESAHWQDAGASFLGGVDGKIAAAVYGGGGGGSDGSAFESLEDQLLRNIREQRRLLLGMKMEDGFGNPLDAPGPSQKWIAELPHKARRLDKALYHRAPSLEAYLDKKTLKARLGSESTDIAARFRERKRRSSPAEGAAAGVGADAGTLSAAQPPPAKMVGQLGGGMADGGRLRSTSGIGAVASESAHWQDAGASFLGGADGKIAAVAYGDGGGDGSAFESLKDQNLRNTREQRRLLLGMKVGDGFGNPLDAPGGIPGGGGASAAAGLKHLQVSSVDFARIMMPEAAALMRSNPFALGADEAHTGTEKMMEAVRPQRQMLLAQKQQQENVVCWCKTAQMQQQQEGGGKLDVPPATAGRTGAEILRPLASATPGTEILPPLASATPGAAHPCTGDDVGQDRPESPPIVPGSFDW